MGKTCQCSFRNKLSVFNSVQTCSDGRKAVDNELHERRLNIESYTQAVRDLIETDRRLTVSQIAPEAGTKLEKQSCSCLLVAIGSL